MVGSDGRQSASVASTITADTVPAPAVDLEGVLGSLPGVDAVWTGPDEPTIVTRGRLERITAGGESRFREIRKRATALFDRLEWSGGPPVARPRLLGGFSFFGSRTLDGPWEGFEPAAFHLPREQLVIADDGAWLTTFQKEADEPRKDPEKTIESLHALYNVRAGSGGRARNREKRADEGRPKQGMSPGIRSESPRVAEDAWKEHVRKITRTIDDSVLRKVVLAQALDVELDAPFELGPVLGALGETYPDCFRFAFHADAPSEGADDQQRANSGPNRVFFGASPERLASTAGRDVTTEALAGTVQRGDSESADSRFEARLRSDEKLHEEHEVVAAEIEEQLAAIGGDVVVGSREVRKLARVQHLRSPITAKADGTDHILDIVEALHPTPAVGGLPPQAAMSVIHEHEPFDRGWYAAPIGWFDEHGDGTFAVGIRSAVVSGTEATLFAGNGLVRDSEPETETEEVRLKFRPVLDHLG